jgi:hypothetical protein
VTLTRVLSKPTYSITLSFLIICTLIFLSLSLPSLVELYHQDQIKDGITIITAVLSLFLTIGFGIYSQQQAALAKTDKKLTDVGSQLVGNNLVLIINKKEEISKIKEQVDSNESLDLSRHEHLKISQLSDAEFLEAIPDQLRNRADFLLSEARQAAEDIDFHREVAHKLEANTDILRRLAVKASNQAIDKQDAKHLQELGLLERSSRGGFYMDIYVYLKGWLRLSIEFNTPMPVSEVSQSKADRKLYIDTFRWIRDNGIDRFGIDDERQKTLSGSMF